MENFTFQTIEYHRPDFDACIKKTEQMLEKMQESKSYEEFKKIFLELEQMNDNIMTMVSVAYIRNTLNTVDEFYEKEIAYLNEQTPIFQDATSKVTRYLVEGPYKDDIAKEYGDFYIKSAQLFLDSFKPELIPYLQEEAKLTVQYQKMMAMAQIPFDNQVLNLYGIQKYFEDKDRETRKKAFQAFSDFYHNNEAELEEIFAKLVDVRTKMGQVFGDKNFINLGYKKQGRTDYGQEQVAQFRQQVLEEVVPLCQKIYEAQAKRIGVDKIKAYDEAFIFPDGNAQPAGDDDYMIKAAREMYHDMSKETGEFIDFMIEHELMDLKNKQNKASTGYMTSLPDYKAPYVFSCFNHTIGDMQVLTHELGHAFAGYQAMRHQPLSEMSSESTDIAEIHSMAMEQFAYPYAEQFFGKDADKFRFAHLQEAITFVPFGVAVDEFQHIMYEHPELTPKERTYEWHKLEQKYMPWRDYDGDEFMERGGFWYYKLHIFLYPFYYINYTLTTMGAMEFKKRFNENKEEAWKDYLTLCNIGGSLSYLDSLKAAHLSIPFEAGSVKRAISYAKDILLKAIESE